MKELIEAWRYRKHIAVLDIHEQFIRLMELKKHRSGIRCIKALERSWESEKSPNEQPEFEILKYAATELNLSRLKVVIHLPQRTFRHHFLKLPLGYNGKVSDWLDENLAQYLPPGLAKNQVVCVYHGFLNSTDSDTVLLTIARRDVIAGWTEIFRKLNLRVVGLIGNEHSLLNGFAFSDRKHHEENRAFLHFDEACIVLIISQQGDVVQYSQYVLDHSEFTSQNNRTSDNIGQNLDRPWQDAIKEKLYDYKKKNGLHRIIVSGENGLQVCEPVFNEIAKIESGGDLIHDFLPNGNSAKYVLLFGLGIQSFYPQFETNDLLPEDFKDEIRDKEEQIHSIHFAGILSLILICIWLILMGANFFVKRELLGWEQEMTKLENQIIQIEELKNAGKMLSSELKMRRNILNQRSHHAKTLFDISKIMPRDVWLRTQRYGQTELGEPDDHEIEDVPIILEGLALAESGPTQLLSEMENVPDFEHVQLELMQSIPAKVVFKKTKLRRAPLIKFKLSARVRP